MDNIELNKIFAAVLIAGIVAYFGGFISRILVHPHFPAEHAVMIEGVEVADVGTAEPQGPEPILHLIAQADPARGQQLSRACAACHTFNEGGASTGLGPNLWNIVNRDKAYVGEFAYSAVIADMPDDWDYRSLNKFLWNPRWYAPGTKMNFVGLRRPEDRAAIIAWMRTLSHDPAPLPTDAEIEAEAAALAPAIQEAVEEAHEELIEDLDVVPPAVFETEPDL